MNPETSPWALINDHQRASDLQRQSQENNIKVSLQRQYRQQLADQIAAQKQYKAHQMHHNKQQQAQLIQSSLQNSRKLIELHSKQAHSHINNQSLISIQNQHYRQAKKQRENIIANKERVLEEDIVQQAQQNQKMATIQRERMKKEWMSGLKQTVQYKQEYDRYWKSKQRELDRAKLQQHQLVTQKQDQQRQSYLNGLKHKAMQMDYGAHQAFNHNHRKQLIDRKLQQQKLNKQNSDQVRQAQQYEQQCRKYLREAGKSYRDQLKQQISFQQYQKSQRARRQREQQALKIDRYRQYSDEMQSKQKQQQLQNKKHYCKSLQKQIQQHRQLSKMTDVMAGRQLQMNSKLLQGSKTIIPGQTYDLDPMRKKQLEIVARSINSQAIGANNYLAERGKNVLY